MKESLDAPQPAMGDEDDPLLAEAIQASLRDAGTDGGAGAGGGGSDRTEEDTRSMLERFPALKAQLAAEQRAAEGGGDAGMAAAMAAAMSEFEFDEQGARPWQPPPPPSPGTLEARRVREEQDEAYQEALAMDRMREESRKQAEREEQEREAAMIAESQAAAQAQQQKEEEAAAAMERMKHELPAEPPAGAGVSTVVVRLSDGSRLPPRRFKESDKVAHIYAHVAIAMREKGIPDAAGPFELVSNMPVRSFKEQDKTLAEVELQGQILLIVQPI